MKFWILSLFCILSAATLSACQRPPRVEAGSEANVKNQDLQGELSKINLENRTIVIRIDNGMEQTVLLNESTSIVTPKRPFPIKKSLSSTRPAKNQATNTMMRSFTGWKGSELRIAWKEHQGMKLATRIIVIG